MLICQPFLWLLVFMANYILKYMHCIYLHFH